MHMQFYTIHYVLCFVDSVSKKGYLHRKKKDLERALKSSRSGFSFTARPYFVKRL